MISTEDYNGVCVLSVAGELVGEECAKVRKAVEESIDQHHVVNFAIDLEKCPYLDSEGLETVCWIKSKCDELFGMMKVVAPDENCRKIFEITRLDQRLELETDLPTALKAMR